MRKFSLKIRSALGLLFCSMLLVSILQGAIAYWKIGNISQATDHLLDNTIPRFRKPMGSTH